MRKKKLVKRVAGIALTVGVVILAIVCVGKVNRIQNEKDIIGTWKDTNAEEVFTFQENGELAVSKDMPDSGLSCGNASYGFSYSDIICVTQGDSSVEFEIEVDHDRTKKILLAHGRIQMRRRYLPFKRTGNLL